MNNTNTQISRKKIEVGKEVRLTLRRLTKLCFAEVCGLIFKQFCMVFISDYF